VYTPRSVQEPEVQQALLEIYALSTDQIISIHKVTPRPREQGAPEPRPRHVWLVRLRSVEIRRRVRQQWFQLYQTLRWQMDDALTTQQLQERSIQQPRFWALKQEGAKPSWRGSVMSVRMTTPGGHPRYYPAEQWDSARREPPRAHREQQQPQPSRTAPAGTASGSSQQRQQPARGPAVASNSTLPAQPPQPGPSQAPLQRQPPSSSAPATARPPTPKATKLVCQMV